MQRDVSDHCSTPSSPHLDEPRSAEPRRDGHRARGADHHVPALPIADKKLPQLVGTPVAARILRRSASTLKRWRYEGIGPNYVEIEGRVSYDVHVLVEFLRRHTRVPSVRAAMEDSRGL